MAESVYPWNGDGPRIEPRDFNRLIICEKKRKENGKWITEKYDDDNDDIDDEYRNRTIYSCDWENLASLL